MGAQGRSATVRCRALGAGLAALLLCVGVCGGREVTLEVRVERTFLPADCLRCHDEVNPRRFANSVHGHLACTACHADIVDLDKHASGAFRTGPVNCGTCHEEIAERYRRSVHHKLANAPCWSCHSEPHYLEGWRGDKATVVRKCTSCHEEESYVRSGHGVAVLRGNQDSAACSDCHGLHDTRIFHTGGRRYPVEARRFYTRACYRCHGDPALAARNGLNPEVIKDYEESVHGKVQKLGYPAAGCADCHTHHNILPPSDPRSTVNPRNLQGVCSRCHRGVNANFVRFLPHPNFKDRHRYPQLFWAVVFMSALLVSTLLFFWLHTLLWWRKAYWEKQRRLAGGHLISDKLAQIENPGETYIRFRLRDRLLHFVGMLSFFGLACTGLPIKFADAPWAKFMLDFIGGVSGAVALHRICAAVLILEFLYVVGLSVHFVFFNKRAGRSWRERLFGPESLCFRRKDLEDFVAMMRWFMDQGPHPRFDRWTYWEKFDFFAVFWGMFAIGLSGLMMWVPELTARLLPGWVLNVARIVHSDEALLAVGFIFTVHFFNTHWVPTKWPMDYSIFTGRIYKWQFIEERPLEYERLRQRGELARRRVPFPPVIANLFAGAVGLGAMFVGLATVIFILWAYFL